MKASEVETLREQAWIGDAVLALYVRQHLLAQMRLNDPRCRHAYQHFTSNQFLSAFEDPTQAEARIGRIYEKNGLDAAFLHIETELLPLFEKQRQKKKS